MITAMKDSAEIQCEEIVGGQGQRLSNHVWRAARERDIK